MIIRNSPLVSQTSEVVGVTQQEGGGGAANEVSSSQSGAAAFAGRGAEGTEGVGAARIFESSLLAEA